MGASELTAAEAREVVEAAQAVRKAGKSAKQAVHGWQIELTVRANARGRGDLCVRDPRDE